MTLLLLPPPPLQYDPWMTQSINVTLSPLLPAVVITGGAHHSDLGGPQNPVPSPDDSPALVSARAFEVATINAWVADVAAERARYARVKL